MRDETWFASALFAFIATVARAVAPILLAISASIFAGAGLWPAVLAKTAQVLPQFAVVALVFVSVLAWKRRAGKRQRNTGWRSVGWRVRKGSELLYVARASMTAAAFVLLAVSIEGLLHDKLSVGYASMATALVGAVTSAIKTTLEIGKRLRSKPRERVGKQFLLLLPVAGCGVGVLVAFEMDPSGLLNPWVGWLALVVALRACVPFLQERITAAEKRDLPADRSVDHAVTTKATLWLGVTVTSLYTLLLSAGPVTGARIEVHFEPLPLVALVLGSLTYAGYSWAWQHANGMQSGSQAVNGIVAVLGTPIGFALAGAFVERPQWHEALAQAGGSAVICASLAAMLWLKKDSKKAA